MSTVALVLGAGGIVGASWHAGALAALAEAGWDARRADLIVGTSAGAHTGATLRLGLSPADHFAHAVDEPLSDDGADLVGDDPPERLRLPERPSLAHPPLPAAPWLVVRALLGPGPVRPALAVAGCTPRGGHDPALVGDRIRRLDPVPGRWPEAPLWLCAVRLRDGARVVFGRDAVTEVDLATAVEASCAICGYFRPVPVGGRDHVDGGVHSPSNLDLVAGLGFDLAVVISPMSTVPAGSWRSPEGWARRVHAGLLAWERDRVERLGTPVLDLSPTPADLAAFGRHSLDHEAGPRVARRARGSVAERLATAEGARAIELLAGQAPAGTSDAQAV